jgi:ribosomal protein S18 acetylase RimI-like enzyme
MDVTIRRCEPRDAAGLALVGQATFLETYAGSLDAADIFAHCATEHAPARYAAWLQDPAYGLWIAEADAGLAPVGYAVLAPPDVSEASPGDVELKRIYVFHRLHGSGVGPRLMSAAIAAAQARGALRLLVGVYDGNSRALAFYARQGFRPAGVRKFRVGAIVHDDPVLALEL